MSRVKRGVAAHKKHKKLLSQAEGRRASKHKLVRPAREAAMHALRYAYRDRRARKGQFRALWIARINAAARDAGVSYSRLMAALRLAGIDEFVGTLSARERARLTSAMALLAEREEIASRCARPTKPRSRRQKDAA